MFAKDRKIAVLMGGAGDERAVSLESGACVLEALISAGVDAVGSDITPDNLSILDDASIDVFFLALHGRFGEDGQLQKILEDRGLAYTGSDSKASAIAFDKIASKIFFDKAGIATPRWAAVQATKDIENLSQNIVNLSCEKFVIKPSCQGSSVGIEIVEGIDKAVVVAKKCFKEYGPTLIEEFIPGRELTVSIVDGEALPIIEIRPKQSFYDFHAKYIDDATEFIVDPISDKGLADEISEAAKESFDLLGCQHVGRVDFILTQGGSFYALEVNTIPGMTSHSLLPKAAAKAGMDMGELYIKIIELTDGQLAKSKIKD